MPFVIVASGESKHASLRDLIREAQRAPDRLLVAGAGETSVARLAIELLHVRHGLRIEPVPYNGGNAALQAVATRQVDAALVPLPSVLPHTRGGRVRILAIAEKQRHPSLPDVPTATEAGLADFEVAGWFGVFAPVATPPTVVRELNVMLAHGFQSRETQQVFSAFGLRLEHRAADTFGELLVRERQRWFSVGAGGPRKS